MLLVIELQELFARDSARVGQQALCIGADRLGLDDGLGVVVIVFELEDVHQRLIGRQAGKLVEYLCAVFGEGLLHLRRRKTGHVGIPAVRQDLGGVLKGGGV